VGFSTPWIVGVAIKFGSSVGVASVGVASGCEIGGGGLVAGSSTGNGRYCAHELKTISPRMQIRLTKEAFIIYPSVSWSYIKENSFSQFPTLPNKLSKYIQSFQQIFIVAMKMPRNGKKETILDKYLCNFDAPQTV